MNPALPVPPAIRTAFAAAIARIDALPGRERLALFGALLAVLVAAELLLVEPVHNRRQQVENATVEQAQRVADEQTQAEQARIDRQNQLEAQLERIDSDLSRLGAGTSSGQSLSFLLTQALARQDVRIVSLREHAVEAIQPAASAEPALDGSMPPPAVALFKHRFELTLAAPPAALIDALRTLDQSARPLRIERARLSGRDEGSVQLTVTLVVIGTERAWLAI